MIPKKKIEEILAGYDKGSLKIATICSHTAQQIFYGARQEGIKTIGICTKERKKFYDSFPLAKPDEYIMVDGASDLPADELVSQNAVLIPHGSLVEYVGEKIHDLPVPIFGNRSSLLWEKSREKMSNWLKEAGIRTPKTINPEKIDRPCIVKFPGAKGGRGYMIVKNTEDFHSRVRNPPAGTLVQEYLIGVRAYPHFFYSPLSKNSYAAGEGSVELMSIDKRLESNVDECYREVAVGVEVKPSFTIIGNTPMVIRESLLPEIMEMGKRTVESAQKLFGGIPGPFCIESIIDENLNFYAFEISARIVAGTNIFPKGSPYSFYTYGEEMSTGRRIARELKIAAKKNALPKIIY